MEFTAAITDIEGLRVGHASDQEALTGCTVILPPPGTVGGVDRRGGATSTRQGDPLRLTHIVEEVHGVVLAGGSAFGLEAATGVASYLEGQGIGFDVNVARVPIVPTAILFDLGLGSSLRRPDAAMGLAACQAARQEPPAEGNVGAGTGATLGKILGPEGAMKSGLGTAAVDVGGGLVVGAIVAANPLGDVIDPTSGEIIAGARMPGGDGTVFADARDILRAMVDGPSMSFASGENTIIGVVVTNGRLDKKRCTLVAQMAQAGVARTVRPAQTAFDGDTMFALATGEVEADVNIVGAFAVEVVMEAILRAVRRAEGVAGLPAWADLQP